MKERELSEVIILLTSSPSGASGFLEAKKQVVIADTYLQRYFWHGLGLALGVISAIATDIMIIEFL